jgi:hypothetical protein
MYNPPPVIVPVVREEDPRCPHCHRKLPGWSEPEDVDFTFKGIFIGVAVSVLIIANLIGFGTGAMDGNFNYCEKPLSKRYHYVIPAHPAGCATARWLSNREVYYEEK